MLNHVSTSIPLKKKKKIVGTLIKRGYIYTSVIIYSWSPLSGIDFLSLSTQLKEANFIDNWKLKQRKYY